MATKRVLITVRDGHAMVEECPDGIEVEIRDYDIDGVEECALDYDSANQAYLSR